MSANLPSFERAEYLQPLVEPRAPLSAGGEACAVCERQLAGRMFLVDQRPTCEACKERALQTPQTGSHAALSRAILFGVGAALVGMVLYASVEILTGWVIGYAAVAVGYLVGKAMKKGSGGRGGRRYQIAAAALTYAAVSLSAIPVGIHAYLKDRPAQVARSGGVRGGELGSDVSPGQMESSQQVDTTDGSPILRLLATGLASPFLDLTEGAGGVIGLFILFIGIRAAWSLTDGTEVLVAGPFQLEEGRDASLLRS